MYSKHFYLEISMENLSMPKLSCLISGVFSGKIDNQTFWMAFAKNNTSLINCLLFGQIYAPHTDPPWSLPHLAAIMSQQFLNCVSVLLELYSQKCHIYIPHTILLSHTNTLTHMYEYTNTLIDTTTSCGRTTSLPMLHVKLGENFIVIPNFCLHQSSLVEGCVCV